MNSKVIFFAKVKPNAILPSKREEDAALDFYACFDEDEMIIEPSENKLMPTGIASAFCDDYALVFRERGSTGIKNIKINAGVVDSGFRNEIFVCLYNANDVPVIITKHPEYYQDKECNSIVIYPYQKAIAQALLIPIPKVLVKEIPYEKLKSFTSERGLGMLGSSNK